MALCWQLRSWGEAVVPWGTTALGLLLTLMSFDSSAAITDNGHVTQVTGVVGHGLDLPCDVTPSDPNDVPVLVLWYKDGQGTPLFSFDARGEDRSLVDSAASLQLIAGARAIFMAQLDPPVLRMATASAEDQGLYRCRMDFRESPTRNHRVNVTITVPPDRPIILHNGRSVTGPLGPLEEGERLELTCTSDGGRPRPRLTWFRGASVLDNTDRSDTSGGTVNQLLLPRLTRSDLHTRLVCSATNNNVSRPAVNVVSIEMNFSPQSVEILGSERASMSAGKTYFLVCRTFGSRPPANITWWIGNKRLDSAEQTISGDANVTSSTLSFRPKPDDDEREVECRAENRLVDGGPWQGRRRLTITYAPMVTLQLGYALNPKDIKEGADIYFDCTIVANPKIYRVTWYHNGLPLESSARSVTWDQVTVNERSLIVRNVTRASAGHYVCKASNAEGDGASHPVHLGIKYAPVCAPGQRSRHGTARGQAVRVLCRVDASPSQVNFRWQLSNSVEVIDLPSSQVISRGQESQASFTPESELDFGALSCLAENEVGRMVTPCTFHIVPAGRPDPVRNCSIVSRTSHSLDVECSPGFDGGLAQYFVAEVFSVVDGRLVRNLTRPFPDFSVPRLPAGRELRLKLYAANGRGRSRAVALQALTRKPPAQRMSQEPGGAPEAEFAVTPVLGVLIGLVASLLVIAVAAVVCIRRSGRVRKSSSQLSRPESPRIVKAGAHPVDVQCPADAVDGFGADDPTDTNPDVVPNGGGPPGGATDTMLRLNQLNGASQKTDGLPSTYSVLKLKTALQDDIDTGYPELTALGSNHVVKVIRGLDRSRGIVNSPKDHEKWARVPGDIVARTPLMSRDQESIV